MPESLRVALLGGGKMALQHAAAIRLSKNARLVAVADPLVPPSELTARFGKEVAPYTDPQEMLAAVKPDVVHVVTPPDTHAALACACLEAGASIYVEKPFALSTADAESVLQLAKFRGLSVCAAHQLLFQSSFKSFRRRLSVIGGIAHVESFFSFRPVRRRAGGGGLNSPVEQLIDILPHPVYLLLDALPPCSDARAEITALDVSIAGEVRAVIRRGDALACLVVSLRARPVESWLRVMGTNGMVEADFVLGSIIKHPGPGASAPAIVLKPFSRAWQIVWGSFKGLLTLAFRRHSSYPGLAELIGLFYTSINERTSPPIGAAEITDTVRLCQIIGERLHSDEDAADKRAAAELRSLEARLPRLIDHGGIILLTGGGGKLGRPTAQTLRQAGRHVRVPVRRSLPPGQQLPGVEYVIADLANPIPDSLLEGVETVIHLAAETAGTKADHERNTIQATRNLLDVMARTKTRRLINISSVAVLKPSRFRRPLREDSPVDYDNLKRGPYVWAKAEAERMAMQAEKAGQIELRTIRLGPLVHYDDFVPPGRLGREVARLFVAMGRPSNSLTVCSISNAAAVLRHYVQTFNTAPELVNLLEVPSPKREELAIRLRSERPDLLLVWVPFWVLRILSITFALVQKIRSPTSNALNLYDAFASQPYDNETAQAVIGAAKLSTAGS